MLHAQDIGTCAISGVDIQGTVRVLAAVCIVLLASSVAHSCICRYGDSNALMRLDVAVSLIDPQLVAILSASVREHDVDSHASNLVGVPTLFRSGAQDATVHPYYSRRMARVLQQLAPSTPSVHDDVARPPSPVHEVEG